MLRRFSIDFAVFSIGVDMAVIVGMLSLAEYIRPMLNDLPYVIDIPRAFQTPLPHPLYIIFPVLWVLILQLVSVYDGRRNLRLINEVASLTLGSILAIITLAGALYLSYRDVSRALFLTFASSSYVLLLIWRLVYRFAYKRGLLQGAQPRRVLIIGAGAIGREFRSQIHSYETLGLEFVGFLDDDPKKNKSDKVLGVLNETCKIVKIKNINDVVIALPPRAFNKVKWLVAELHSLPVKVWLIPDYFHLALHKAAPEEFAGIPMLDLRAPALNDFQRMVKRSFDLTVVILFLPATLIIMAVIAFAIWIESGRPIFFRQQRVGENGKLFNILKFRTMVPNAEKLRYLVEHKDEDGNLIHKVPDDPRVTRVGRYLRQTSLDEIPQIFNVLRGDMSLVGPRPELPYLVEKYETWQRKRFAVQPGVTGWWQINGRSDRPMHLNTEDDLYYVQNYSLLLDVQILFRTIGVVLKGKGAY